MNTHSSDAAGVRVEWLKARARSLRWYEELLLLPEEIRRTVETHHFKAEWWLERASMRSACVDAALQEGLTAYATRQAYIRRGLARQVGALWSKTAKTALAALEEDGVDAKGRVSMAIRDGLALIPPDTLLAKVASGADSGGIHRADGVDSADTDDDADVDSDDEGVEELEESEAVVAFMELDVE